MLVNHATHKCKKTLNIVINMLFLISPFTSSLFKRFLQGTMGDREVKWYEDFDNEQCLANEHKKNQRYSSRWVLKNLSMARSLEDLNDTLSIEEPFFG